MSDQGFLGKLLEWGWAAILVLVSWWHRQNTEKLREITDALSNKADKEEVNKQQDRLDTMAERLRAIEIASARIDMSAQRIVSHLDSEQRTRAEVNKELLRGMKELMGRTRDRRESDS